MQKKMLAAMVALAVGQQAHAADNDWLKFSGFGTLGVAHSSDKGADFRANIEQTQGPGMTHKIDSGLDSVFGAQADVRLLPKLTGTAQIISRRMSDYGSTRPYFEWANLKYQLTNDLFIRGGRIVAPMFMISESRMVGFGQTAVRPAGEVYTINPITYMNGADIGYRFEAGPVLYKLGAAMGNLNQMIGGGAGVNSYRFRNKLVNATAEYEGSSLRLAYARIGIDITSDNLNAYDAGMNALVNAGAIPEAARDNTQHAGIYADFYNVGYVYDKNDWLVQAEYGSRKIDKDSIVDMDGYWLLAGYRIGKWMPYLSWSHMAHKSAINLPTNTANPLVNAINGNFMRRYERTNVGAGVRWDVLDNVALKVQVERIDKPANSVAYFFPDPTRGSTVSTDFLANERKINVYSATLDFVF